jgi:hypothetical protein
VDQAHYNPPGAMVVSGYVKNRDSVAIGGAGTIVTRNYYGFAADEVTTTLNPDSTISVKDGGISWEKLASPVADTTILKSTNADVAILKTVVSGKEIGGGVFVKIDSTYPEGVVAFNHPTQGKQWVREEYLQTGIVNVKWAGAIGNGITNDRAAIQSAITCVSKLQIGGSVFFPAGTYVIGSALDTILTTRMSFVGDGKLSTVLKFTGIGSMFVFGRYSNAPTSFYQDEAQDYRFENIMLDGDETSVTEGSRTRTAVEDNGSGSGVFRNFSIKGFRFGFKANYGSDFTHFEEGLIWYCDIAIYLGPVSQQTDIEKIQFFNNREGIVNEGAPQGRIAASYFIDQKVADIVFEANSTTRSGVIRPGNDVYELSYAVENCWFESNADNTLHRIVDNHVLIHGNLSASLPRYIKIRNSHIVSGGAVSDSNSFLRVNGAGTKILLENTLIAGNQLKYVVRISGSGFYPQITQVNTQFIDGMTNGVLWGPTKCFNCVDRDDWSMILNGHLRVNDLITTSDNTNLELGTNDTSQIIIESSAATVIKNKLFLGTAKKSRIDGNTTGELALNYNTSSTGSLIWYGGGTTGLFTVDPNGTTVVTKIKINPTGSLIDSAVVVADTLKFYVGGVAYKAVK